MRNQRLAEELHIRREQTGAALGLVHRRYAEFGESRQDGVGHAGDITKHYIHAILANADDCPICSICWHFGRLASLAASARRRGPWIDPARGHPSDCGRAQNPGEVIHANLGMTLTDAGRLGLARVERALDQVARDVAQTRRGRDSATDSTAVLRTLSGTQLANLPR